MITRRFLFVAAAIAALLSPHAVAAAPGGGKGKPAPSEKVDLASSLTDSVDPVMIGSEFSYDAILTNAGTVTAPDVSVSVGIRDADFRGTAVYSSVTSSRGSCSIQSYGPGKDLPVGATSDLWLVIRERQSIPVCQVGTLAPGEQVTIRVVVRPTWPTRENAYGYTSLSADLHHTFTYEDTNDANQDDFEDTTVTTGNALADCVLDRSIYELCAA